MERKNSKIMCTQLFLLVTFAVVVLIQGIEAASITPLKTNVIIASEKESIKNTQLGTSRQLDDASLNSTASNSDSGSNGEVFYDSGMYDSEKYGGRSTGESAGNSISTGIQNNSGGSTSSSAVNTFTNAGWPFSGGNLFGGDGAGFGNSISAAINKALEGMPKTTSSSINNGGGITNSNAISINNDDEGVANAESIAVNNGEGIVDNKVVVIIPASTPSPPATPVNVTEVDSASVDVTEEDSATVDVAEEDSASVVVAEEDSAHVNTSELDSAHVIAPELDSASVTVPVSPPAQIPAAAPTPMIITIPINLTIVTAPAPSSNPVQIVMVPSPVFVPVNLFGYPAATNGVSFGVYGRNNGGFVSSNSAVVNNGPGGVTNSFSTAVNTGGGFGGGLYGSGGLSTGFYNNGMFNGLFMGSGLYGGNIGGGVADSKSAVINNVPGRTFSSAGPTVTVNGKPMYTGSKVGVSNFAASINGGAGGLANSASSSVNNG